MSGNVPEIIYFESPKVGVFNIEAHKYDPEKGWLQIEKEVEIIGTVGEHWYLYEMRRLHPDHGLNGKKPKPTMTDKDLFIPLSIHKSRLIEWKIY